MFHVFYINKGFMLVLQPAALDTVLDLKKCILDSTGIPLVEQILFLCGGASLTSETSLQQISDAGTYTNPVFLLKRISGPLELGGPADHSITQLEEDGINELYQSWQLKLEQVNKLQSTSSTINEYVALAKNGLHVAEVTIKFCAKIVSEHQFLNQGWMVVIANLDDNISRMQKRIDRARGQSERLEAMKKRGRELLAEFESSLDSLSRITIPRTLLLASSVCSESENTCGNVDEMSMFDWISSKDPSYSLEFLEQHVEEHLEKVDSVDLNEASCDFGAVRDLARTGVYRDINGIDKRLAMLDAKLRTLEESFNVVRQIASQMTQLQPDPAHLTVANQRRLAEEFAKRLKDLHDYGIAFIKSKTELLENIRSRFTGWVRKAYDYLHKSHKKIIIFEDKYVGLRQRLDLAKQIKDAPLVYMAAVVEVLRREALKKEFDAWIALHTEKCAAFLNEENRLREEFLAKLERHFLKLLFPGMTDRVPAFSVKSIPKFDVAIPNVSAEQLVELRKNFPGMNNSLLKIPSPRVFPRLAVNDPLQQSRAVEAQTPQSSTKFFRHFPSSNWLSVEDMEMSPSNASLNRTGELFQTMFNIGDASSLQSPPMGNNPLRELGASSFENDYVRKSMSPLRPSAPIDIPQQKSRTSLGGGDVGGASLSEKSFGTPIDTMMSMTKIDAAFSGTTKSPPNASSPFQSVPIVRPQSLQHSLIASQKLSSEGFLVPNRSNFVRLFSRVASFSDLIRGVSSDLNELTKECSKTFDELKTGNNADIEALKEKLEQIFTDKMNECNAKNENICKEKCEDMEKMYAEKVKLLEQELEREKLANSEKDAEIDGLKAENLNLKSELSGLQNSMDDLHADVIRLEQDRNNLNAELEILKQETEQQKLQLIEKVSIEQQTDSVKNLEAASNTIIVNQSNNQTQKDNDGRQALEETNKLDETCDFDQSESILVAPNESVYIKRRASNGGSASLATQTKIRLKHMTLMVSLNELFEDCATMIIWDAVHNAYIAYCTGQSLYFVRDESLPSIGLKPPIRQNSGGNKGQGEDAAGSQQQPQPRGGPRFAQVKSIELCRTRKADNRYNLPLGSRFSRISVVPLSGLEHSFSCTSSGNSSSRRSYATAEQQHKGGASGSKSHKGKDESENQQ